MQHENVYERIHRTLTWKRIVTFNVLLFLVTVIPLSVRLAQQDTENRSSAAVNEAPVVTPPPSYPAQGPVIERVTEWFGKKGDVIVLLGKNFGDYQWGSKVFVGNSEASEENIVRWSDSVIEVQIPEGARTGSVWIVVNSRQARWDGSLLLTDVNKSARIEIERVSRTQGNISISGASGVVRGIIEIGHDSSPLSGKISNGEIITQSETVDSLGKKTEISFQLNSALGSSKSLVAQISYPGIGTLEILRTELYDASGKLVPVFADPLGIKMLPN